MVALLPIDASAYPKGNVRKTDQSITFFYYWSRYTYLSYKSIFTGENQSKHLSIVTPSFILSQPHDLTIDMINEWLQTPNYPYYHKNKLRTYHELFSAFPPQVFMVIDVPANRILGFILFNYELPSGKITAQAFLPNPHHTLPRKLSQTLTNLLEQTYLEVLAGDTLPSDPS